MVTLVITGSFSIRAVKKCACCFKCSFYILYTYLKNILFWTKLEALQGKTVVLHLSSVVLKDLRTTPTEMARYLLCSIEVWMVTKPTWKIQMQLKSFPVFYRRVWVEIFLKYNTGIPSSVSIPRHNETKESDLNVRKFGKISIYSRKQKVCDLTK